MKENIYNPVNEYSIDLIPLNKDEFIKLYDSVLDIFDEDLIYGLLYIFSRQFHEMIKETQKHTISSDASLATLYFLANTGYNLAFYKPNETIQNYIINQPDLAVTDLDRALISLINFEYIAILYPSDKSEEKAKEKLYSYIFFLNSVQNYEYKTHMTLDLSSEDVLSYEFNEDFFFNLLTKPRFSETNPKMIPISETDVNNLKIVLEFRKKLNELIFEVRKAEHEYAQNKRNEYIWLLFISWLNYRSSEETNILEMISSDASLEDKLEFFDRFLSEIDDPNIKVLDSELCLFELKNKILERLSCACNYMEIQINDKQNHVLDDIEIYSLFSPYSFSFVLVSFHAFLIIPSKRYLEFLVTSIEGFIRNNLEQEDSNIETSTNHSTVVERLIRVSNLIIKFYEAHEETINTLRFDSIQKDDTLSGQGYDYEIFRLLNVKEQRMMEENVAALSKLDHDDVIVFIEDYFFALLGEESMDEVKYDIHENLPNNFNDEDKLLEQTVSNRLIVSINAIYILVKIIDRLLDQHLIEETQYKDLYRINKRLSIIEQTIVTNSYLVPMLSCLDSEDKESIKEYRLRIGIDASKIEAKYDELRHITLFNLAKSYIRELRSEMDSGELDIFKASEIKEKLRKKFEDFPDCATREFVIELIDQESQFICEVLVSNNAGCDEFSQIKKELYVSIGPLSSILPEKVIDTLTTAELLYARYAKPEYADVGFDYSCISVLYYQAVEAMYNELFWSKYADYLNNLDIGDDCFTNLYSDKSSHDLVQGYLPTEKTYEYMSKKKRIHNFLMMGPFCVLLEHLTSNQSTEMCFLRDYFDSIFGYEKDNRNTEEYQVFQNNIDILYSKIYKAKDKRNAASHGKNKITIGKCKADKALVLPDLASIRDDYLGLIRLFLSLYRRTES